MLSLSERKSYMSHVYYRDGVLPKLAVDCTSGSVSAWLGWYLSRDTAGKSVNVTQAEYTFRRLRKSRVSRHS